MPESGVGLGDCAETLKATLLSLKLKVGCYRWPVQFTENM